MAERKQYIQKEVDAAAAKKVAAAKAAKAKKAAERKAAQEG